MATVTECDRCGEVVRGAAPGLDLEIPGDTTRGTRGKYELCAECAEEFVVWLNQPQAAIALDRQP